MHDIYSPKPINSNQELLQAAELLFELASTVETRIKTSKGVKTAYFDSPQHLASGVFPHLANNDIEAIWVMLNPPPADRFPQAPNKFCALKETTDDSEISRLLWLLVDFDPVRFGSDGKPLTKQKICVTPQERKRATELAEKVRTELASDQWPEPVVIASGNGIQLWYRIDLENTEENRSLLEGVLAGLSLKYSTPEVDIDESTWNPSRLGRLPGTVNRKGGKAAPERPHCWAYLISKPDVLQPALADLLQAIAPIAPTTEADENDSQPEPAIQSKSWIAGWIAKHNLPVVMEKPWKGKGYRWILRDCPFGGVHGEGKAFIIRQASGEIGAGCLHSDCHGKNWYDLRDRIEPGWREKAEQTGKKGATASRNQASHLLEALDNVCKLFRGSDGKSYAAVEVDGQREIYHVDSQAFKHWVIRYCLAVLHKVPSSETVSNVLHTLTAVAQGFATKEIYHRVANVGEAIYLDLGNKDGQVVEITAEGWQVITKPPVYFRRAATTAALPVPVAGGDLTELKPFLNHGSEDNFILSVAWLLAALRGVAPYPIAIITGPHGSAKSTYVEVLRKLVDPASLVNTRSLPKDERDLAIAGCNNFALAFTNVSYVPPALSDALCRLAKGEGFGTRALHTNADEALFGYANPVLLDGIEDFAERPDLLDRAVLISLSAIPEEQRREELTLWAEFDQARPRILGALLDAVSVGLCNLPRTKLHKLPRMADFARWVSACESALPWPQGGFMAAYEGSHETGNDIAFNSSVVAQAIYEWFGQLGQSEWEGTATELGGVFEQGQFDKYTKNKAWPKSPNGLSGKLRRDMHTLRSRGVQVEFPESRKGKDRKRSVRICKLETMPEPSGRPMVTDVTDLFPFLKGKGKIENNNNNTQLNTHGHIEGKVTENIGQTGHIGHPTRFEGPVECSVEELERQMRQFGAS